ncbi:MAG: hypothetical protein PHI02_08645 [Sulfurovaceae bacterium]|nr:hypothetical protein [Sulfurovaceae bacterium]MDD5360322.1 hypothetical protein [Sulfurovaceae bacterium]
MTLIVAPTSPVPLIVGVVSLVIPSPSTPLSEAGSSSAVSSGEVLPLPPPPPPSKANGARANIHIGELPAKSEPKL